MKPCRLLLIITLLFAPTVGAQEILDQNYDLSSSGSGSSGIGATDKAQVVTAGQDGILNRIDVFVRDTSAIGSLHLNILPTIGGIPEDLTNSYAAFIQPASAISSSYNWLSFDVVSARLGFNAGDTFAISLTSATGSFYWRTGSSSIGYAGGDGYFKNDSSDPYYWTATSYDHSFRSYVQGPVAAGKDLPFFEDFENGAGRWTVSNGVWGLGTPSQPKISQAYSGSNSWMTDLDGDYPSNPNTSVVSPEFAYSGFSEDPQTSLALSWNSQVWNDGMVMEMDLADGQGWQLVGDEDWYNATVTNNTPAGMMGQFWGGEDQPWTIVRHRLVGTAGIPSLRLRMRFQCNHLSTSTCKWGRTVSVTSTITTEARLESPVACRAWSSCQEAPQTGSTPAPMPST